MLVSGCMLAALGSGRLESRTRIDSEDRSKKRNRPRKVESEMGQLLAEALEALLGVRVGTDAAARLHQAAHRVEATIAEKMGGMTAGLGLPPGFKLPF